MAVWIEKWNQLLKAERWLAIVRYIIGPFLASRPGNPFFLALPVQTIRADTG
jgi:hypothetical protein